METENSERLLYASVHLREDLRRRTVARWISSRGRGDALEGDAGQLVALDRDDPSVLDRVRPRTTGSNARSWADPEASVVRARASSRRSRDLRESSRRSGRASSSSRARV